VLLNEEHQVGALDDVLLLQLGRVQRWKDLSDDIPHPSTATALALDLDLDFLCFMRPEPHFSYRNPVERCFSLGSLLKENVNCENDVEPQYFTRMLGVPVCGNCGDDSEEDLAGDHLVPPTAEDLSLFSMVAPQSKTAKKAKRSAKQQERATRDAEQRANHMA